MNDGDTNILVLKTEWLSERVFHHNDILDPEHPSVESYAYKTLTVNDWIGDFYLTLAHDKVSLDDTDEVVDRIKARGWMGDAEQDHVLFETLYQHQSDHKEARIHAAHEVQDMLRNEFQSLRPWVRDIEA
tara:strand:+ start:638 stop:1027 length:390 start_codon:yes stop_codon:yes gene_type:complete